MDCLFLALLLLTSAQRDVNENRCTLNDLTGNSHREPLTMKQLHHLCTVLIAPEFVAIKSLLELFGLKNDWMTVNSISAISLFSASVQPPSL